jgi:hypothetical protein
LKKYLAAIVLIVVLLAVFIPFASSNPDGLEKVVATFGVEEHAPIWNGLMFDYYVGAIGNPYISTLIAGVFGTLIVLLATFLLGTAIAPKKTQPVSNAH